MTITRYEINIVELWCTYAKESTSKGKIKVIVDGKAFTVEDYVRKVYEEHNFIVVRGADLELFLRFCCAKWNIETGIGGAGDKFVTLLAANNATCTSGMIPNRYDTLVSNAYQMWLDYYKNPPKNAFGKILLDSTRCFEKTELINLLQKYNSSSQYGVIGAPDFFVYNPRTREKQFIEVKSFADSLRFDQLKFASMITNFVGSYFTVAFVLPSNHDELQESKTAKTVLDIGASHLKKLYQMNFDELWSNYLATKDKKAFARNQCGVNPNCLAFFLYKTKNVLPDYNSNDLDFQGRILGAGLDEYFGRLEEEWSKLNDKTK
jgi:VRR-NUC domain